jgi:hypothetical protein
MVERVYGRMPVESLRNSLAGELEQNTRPTRPAASLVFLGKYCAHVNFQAHGSGF